MKLVLILTIFTIFILFNLYIRVKTLRYYRELVQKRIQFKFSDLFNKEKWELILSRYPQEHLILNKFRIHILNTGALFVSTIIFVLFLLFIFR